MPQDEPNPDSAVSSQIIYLWSKAGHVLALRRSFFAPQEQLVPWVQWGWNRVLEICYSTYQLLGAGESRLFLILFRMGRMIISPFFTELLHGYMYFSNVNELIFIAEFQTKAEESTCNFAQVLLFAKETQSTKLFIVFSELQAIWGVGVIPLHVSQRGLKTWSELVWTTEPLTSCIMSSTNFYFSDMI